MMRMMLFYISFLFLLIPVTAFGAEYYVATTGNDSNPGNFDSPWRTIQHAAEMVASGDTIYIRGGTYYEKVTIENLQGRADAWITFRPYNNEKVIVDASTFPVQYSGIFEIRGSSSFIRISGLELKSTKDHGIFLWARWHGDEVTDIRIDHCIIHDCESSGIFALSGHQSNEPIQYVRRVEFDHNTVYDVNNGYSYQNPPTVSPQEAISFCNVQGFNIHHNTLSSYGKEGIDVKSGSSHGSIHHNIINTSLAPGNFQWDYHHVGIYVDGMSRKNQNISVYSNYITGYGGDGIIIGPAELDGGSVENIQVYNNLIHIIHLAGHTYWRPIDSLYNRDFINVSIYSNSIYVAEGGPFRIFPDKDHIVNLVIANNIIAGTTYESFYFQKLVSTDAPGRVTLTHNLYYRYGGTNHNTWADGYDKSWGTNYIIDDPGYIDKDAGNFHITGVSPAFNNGTGTFVSLFDYDGVTRPQLGGYDIGAFECLSLTPGSPSITLEKRVDKSTITLGGTLTYTITYKNIGSATANDVVIIEVLPEKTLLESEVKSQESGVSYWYDNNWQSTFSNKATKIRWIIPELLPQSEGSLSFVVRVK
ncbi:MAG: choice-of-anchor Q domain-containing protein [bacterium]